MTAREYLTRYRDAVRESREIELKITQLRLRYAAPSAINYSDMPKAHNNSDLSDYMEKLEELTELLYAKYERCLGIMIDIEMRLDRWRAQTLSWKGKYPAQVHGYHGSGAPVFVGCCR